jgi:hypothetical protein
MREWYSQVVEALQLSLLEWKFFKGANAAPAPVPAKDAARYEEVEEICLQRGQRSYRVVRKLVEGA